MPRKSSPVPAQTVGRAVELLRLAASSEMRDLTLTEFAEMAGLDRSTTHRLLQRLVHERMLVKGDGPHGYRLGPFLYELGLAVPPSTKLSNIAADAIRRLADQTGEMIFLVQRGVLDTVCVDCVTGKFAISAMTSGIGDRHPLGVGAGGLAIMAALPDEDVESILAQIKARLGRYRVTEASVRTRIADARTRGYVLGQRSGPLDATSLGKAVFGPEGSPIGAVYVAMISRRTDEVRLRSVHQKLVACTAEIESALKA